MSQKKPKRTKSARRRKKGTGRRSGGGVMSGMRGGFKSVVGANSSAKEPSRQVKMFWNVVTVLLLLLAAYLLLQRLGYL